MINGEFIRKIDSKLFMTGFVFAEGFHQVIFTW
jgi:hypothetical protein